MSTSIEAALLGCGHPHSTAHLQTLVTMPEIGRLHLWDPEPGVAASLAARCGAKPATVHDDLAAVLSAPAVRWLLVSLRNDLAPDVLLACAEAGKPVLAEKPIGRGSAETAAVVTAFRNRGVSLAVCFQNRYKPAARLIRTWLAEGRLGRVCSAETRLHTTRVGLRNPRHWLFQQSLSGGGILPWLGCHYLDLLRWTMGAEVRTVTAQTAILSGEEIDVEDLAVLTLGFDNGALATATFGYLMPGGNPGYLSPGYDTWFGLKGTAGHIDWNPFGSDQQVTMFSLHPDWVGAPLRQLSFTEEPAEAYGGRSGLQFAQDCLAAALRGEDGPTCGEDLLAVWQIIEAAYHSARDGRRIDR